MRPFLLLLFCLCLNSCGEKFEKIKKINSDLIKTFNHEAVNTKISWSDNPNNDKIEITFHHFKVSGTSYYDLSELASKIYQRARELNPETKHKSNYEIRFTEGPDNELAEYVTFNFKNERNK